ncbi:nitrite and sulphite reductase 4Fe-4S region [Desulfotomaculum nigrificans CO-1-SRB]|uniref:Nitrite and sulphite reductase 4Fe-4S region n=1 Tax=Desulfotomaculum nigrificans (strain DSM 14880 / VKM B-2319 / CO-1-SRB) TaxID=868595 RepID=F6B3L5_DESCC|nr:nitrite reductase [Desulfotomaculum nigrificans]AEF94044.1 nitrite and sulphite reductase 4Fe-4S region [Desulfotomaculum nigrificans CO-1-SRB]
MGEAIFRQQRNGLYAVNIVVPGGIFTPEQLTGLAEAARDIGVWRIKCGIRQTLIAVLEQDKIPALLEKIQGLGMQVAPFGSKIRSVKACPGGAELCPRALGPALELGMELQERYLGQDVPKDFKISTAGCPRGCTEPYCADLGLIAKGGDNFDIVIGGRGSTTKPVHGTSIVSAVSRKKVFAVVDFLLDQYRKLAEPHERLCSTIARLGIEPFIPPEKIYLDQEQQQDEFAAFLME